VLADQARIWVQAGAGGNGVTSFRREAHVPMGGPDGGDGGFGGSVVLVCDDSLRDLQSFKRRQQYAAQRGRHGEGSQRHGAEGDDLVIKVPPGTVVTFEDDGTSHDLVVPGSKVVVARGGSGGRGNVKFKSSTRQAPRFAEKGLPGEERWLELKLKLLADVGLIGLPNAGKSSLLATMTRASSKVGAYPFTTLSPVLGTLDGEDRQLVLADIPGLIEGAAEGAGLGHDFLQHVERCRLLVHVLDLAPLDGSDPEANFATIEAELASYDERLAGLPRMLVLSKADLVGPQVAEAAAGRWRARFAAEVPASEPWEDPVQPVPVLVTSSATRLGLDELAAELLRRVPVADDGITPVEGLRPDEPLAEHRTFRPGGSGGRDFEVERLGDGEFRVTGGAVDALIARHDLENEDALAHVERRLHRMGVVRALEAQGFEPGDDVELGGVVFQLDP
jgi:GTPase